MSPCGNERIVYDFHMRRGAVSARAMTILRYAEASALDDNVQWRIMPRPRSLRDHSHLNLLMVKNYGKVQSPVAEQWTCSYVETLWSTSFWNGKVQSPVATAMDL